ncbi:hypothetical protein D3C81_2003830 [compost metagenome]
MLITWKKHTASMVTMALSALMASCGGMSSTLSMTLILRPMRSITGTMMFSPGLRVLV